MERRYLVGDLSHLLSNLPVAQLPNIQEAIYWARQKIGFLDPPSSSTHQVLNVGEYNSTSCLV